MAISFNYILVEDDTNVYQYILKKMAEFKRWQHKGSFAYIEEAKECVNRHRPELIFLDWELRDGTGFDLINHISTMPNYLPYIIFFTAHNKNSIPGDALNNYKKYVQGYTDKPIQSYMHQYLATHIHNVEFQYHNPAELFMLQPQGSKIKINLLEVYKIEVDPLNPRNKILFFLNQPKQIKVKHTWEEIMEILDLGKIPFFIANKRKCIVISKFIKEKSKPYLFLYNDEKIEVASGNWYE